MNDRISRYARGYAEVARIQATFAQILAAHGLDPDLDTFEADILVDAEVHRAAADRAEKDGVDFAAVARALLFRAAAEATPDPRYDPARRPPFRPKAPARARLRFWLPRAPYEEAKKIILASRRSVAHALEDQLRVYIDQGMEITDGPAYEDQGRDRRGEVLPGPAPGVDVRAVSPRAG